MQGKRYVRKGTVNMPVNRVDRRAFTASATGIAAGIFATSLPRVSAQGNTTPAAITPQGFVSTRIRTVETPEARDAVNELVLDQFIPEVEDLEGFEGYLLGNVIDIDAASLSVVVLSDEERAAGFNEIATEFVAGLEESVSTVDTIQWTGDLLISGGPSASDGTPVASEAVTEGYVAVRVHTSLPGTDPNDFVPLATSDFLPIVTALPGFEGYLWYPTDGGFVAISLYDSIESAEESNVAALDWAAEFLTEYTDGNPEIIEANVVYANLPIIR